MKTVSAAEVAKMLAEYIGAREVKEMKKWCYNLSENAWEYVGVITVECDDEPICVNTDDEHYLIVNDAKIVFDEEIRKSF